METKIYQKIASLVEAIANCKKSANTEWEMRHGDFIDAIMRNLAPSGSGIDSGTKFLLEESMGEKLVFSFGFHHMNEGGFYDGWTEHKLTVRPSLSSGFAMTISGKDRNGIKDYLYDVYSCFLNQEIDWQEFYEKNKLA